ncbi:MAG: hypothetical protein VYD05_04300, partial [Planctomycetota bacterium]|nr:hypothetical protein [Planctomycetota bacterium]
HNFTVIGGDRPAGVNPTDELVEFRDNSRVQFLNCTFMDAGKEVINDKVTDGEVNNNTTVCGAGSLVPQLLTRMTTPATQTYANNPFGNPSAAYQAQNSSGNLNEFRGCVYYNNNSSSAYTEALGYGVFAANPVAGTNHANNTISLTMPVQSRVRSATTFIGSGSSNHGVNPITFLDPTPAGDALTVAEVSPNDGFFRQAPYCGGFAPGNNWLIGWSRTSAYGLTTQRGAGVTEPIHGVEAGGAQGHPVLATTGTLASGGSITQTVSNLPSIGGLNVGLVVFALAPANPVNPAAGINPGVFGIDSLIPSPFGTVSVLTGFGGSASYSFPIPNVSVSGLTAYSQGFALDPSLPANTFGVSNAQIHRF